MTGHVSAILWAQWRCFANTFRRGSSGATAAAALAVVVWYGMWCALAAAVFALTSRPEARAVVERALPGGLLFVLVYWQVAPILAASLGAAVDLRRLRAYPVPTDALFGIEVALRLSTSVEMLLLLGGAAAGLVWNPAAGGVAAAGAFAVYAAFNLLVAAGVRNQIERWLARTRIREAIVLLLVLTAALPQLLIVTGVPGPLRQWLAVTASGWWPWAAVARLGLGAGGVWDWLLLAGWTAGAWFFGRRQFERSLRAEGPTEGAAPAGGRASWSLAERLWRLPGALLPDPLAALVEKELRTLARSPRFRLVFIMGFTFGVIIFLPVILRGGRLGAASPVGAGYLVLVGAYALLLLGDVAFWNIFGFDRAAAQTYFLAPAPLARVMIAKNLATAVFVVLEMAAITVVWAVARLPLTAPKVAEAFLVTLVLAVYFMAAGNLASAYYPRPVDPEKSTGAASPMRVRLMLLLLYPLGAVPVALAYGARYAFDREGAFYGVLGFAAALGVAVYWAALDSALVRLEQHRDAFLAQLAGSEGPLVSG
jgi:ABC-2 type transport system permease protein